VAEVIFYHLTRNPVDVTLQGLLTRALERKWRVVVRGRERARLEWLDEKLWMGAEEDFLPHGLSGGPHDADQPVLLTETRALPNGAACLMTVDGALLDPAEAAGLERVCVLFDGNNTEELEGARGLWKTIASAGLAAQYWSEESGRWEKKMERPSG